MTTAMDTCALILLASGRSQRFGVADKLLADLAGRPLFEHAAAVLRAIPCHVRIAVCNPASHAIIQRLRMDFDIVANPWPEKGQGAAIALAAARAAASGADRALVSLADMPFVTRGMIEAVIGALDADPTLSAAYCGTGRPSPPVAFDRRCFDALMTLEGDDAGRSLLRSGRFRTSGLAMAAETLADVDTLEDLAAARARCWSGIGAAPSERGGQASAGAAGED